MPEDPTSTPPAPWWNRQQSPDATAEEGLEAAPADDGAPAPAGGPRRPQERGNVPWLGQTEPFLRALGRSLEPLEDRLARIADVARANHAELTRLVPETREGLAAITEALAQTRAAIASSADEVGARADTARDAASGSGAAALAAIDRVVDLVRTLEDGVVQRLVAVEAALTSATQAQRASGESLATSVLDAVAETEQRLGQLSKEIEDRATGAQSANREQLERRLAAGVEQLGRTVAELEQRTSAGVTAVGERAVATVREAEEALATRHAEATLMLEGLVKQGHTELAAQVASSAEELDARFAAAVAEAEDATEMRLAAVAEDLGARLDAIRASAAALAGRADVAALKTRLDELTANFSSLLERAKVDFRDAVSESGAELGQRQDQATERLAQRVTAHTRTLEEGLSRIHRLGSLIEAMATRRGFRELVESEERLREEQGAFVTALTDAARSFEAAFEEVVAKADELGRTLEETAQDAVVLRQVPQDASQQVGQAVSEASDRLARKLRETFADDVTGATTKLRRELESGVPVAQVLQTLERMAGTQADLAAAHREVTAKASAIERETEQLRLRMEGWGEPRSVPHLAEELAALDERVGGIEKQIAEDLGPAISKLVTEQVLEALDEREREKPKGRFRRS